VRKTIFILFFLVSLQNYAVEKVKIAVQPDYVPYLRMLNDVPTRLCGDKAASKLKSAQFEFEYSQLPFPRALKEIENGNSDAIMMVLKNPKRESFILYPNRFLCQESLAVFSLNDTQDIKSLAELTGMHVGFIRGFSNGYTIDHLDGVLRLEVTDKAALVGVLMNKRVSFIVGSDLVIEHHLNEKRLSNLVKKQPVKITDDFKLYIGISKKSRFKNEILEMLDSM
jgi:hypothetical protein